MRRFARDTKVGVQNTRMEIERTIIRYGASKFAYFLQEGHAMVAFEMKNKRIRFILPLPDKSKKEFWQTPSGRMRKNPEAAFIAWEQSTRSSWRALLLSIKAKLETVESGIAAFEEEFLSYIVVNGNKTIGERVIPQIDVMYKTGKVPALEFKG